MSIEEKIGESILQLAGLSQLITAVRNVVERGQSFTSTLEIATKDKPKVLVYLQVTLLQVITACNGV
jgi:hypothetical protein